MKAATFATVKRTDHRAELKKAVDAFKKLEVLVGIPEGGKGDVRKGTPITNSQLGWIHEKGSPAANIPPRPFLVPGVMSKKKEITSGLKSAFQMALHGDAAGGEARLEALGLQVAASVKEYMTNADFEPLKPSSIENRHRNRGTKPRPEERRFIKRNGVKVPNPDFGKGVKPLIDTGALRNAIDSFVVKGKK